MTRLRQSVLGFVAMFCVVLFTLQAGAQSEEHSAPLRLKYLGAAGWEISDGDVVVLIDPYISRLKYGGGGHPDDDRPDFTREDVAQSDTDLIDKALQTPLSLRTLDFGSSDWQPTLHPPKSLVA